MSAKPNGVTVIECEKTVATLPLAAKKVAEEAQRVFHIKSRKAQHMLANGALCAAGLIKEGESL